MLIKQVQSVKIHAYLSEQAYSKDLCLAHTYRYSEFPVYMVKGLYAVIQNINTNFENLILELRDKDHLRFSPYVILAIAVYLKKGISHTFILSYIDSPKKCLILYAIYRNLFGPKISKSFKKLISLILYRFRDNERAFLEDTSEVGYAYTDMLKYIDRRMDYPLPKHFVAFLNSNKILYPVATPCMNSRKMFCKGFQKDYLMMSFATKENIKSQNKHIDKADYKAYLIATMPEDRLVLNYDYLMKENYQRQIYKVLDNRINSSTSNPFFKYLKGFDCGSIQLPHKTTFLVNLHRNEYICEHEGLRQEIHILYFLKQLKSPVDVIIQNASSSFKRKVKSLQHYVVYTDNIYMPTIDINSNRLIVIDLSRDINYSFLQYISGYMQIYIYGLPDRVLYGRLVQYPQIVYLSGALERLLFCIEEVEKQEDLSGFKLAKAFIDFYTDVKCSKVCSNCIACVFDAHLNKKCIIERSSIYE